jgi:hypothetical protein
VIAGALARAARYDGRMTRTIAVGIAAVLIGCGGGDAGEPIEGTIAFTVGSETIVPTAGAALRLESTPPNQMMLLIATSEARCGIDGTGDPPDWFLQTFVDSTMPGTWEVSIGILHIAGENDSISSAGLGTVVIDSIGAERVTGSITYADADSVPAVSASGTFDIIRCF